MQKRLNNSKIDSTPHKTANGKDFIVLTFSPKVEILGIVGIPVAAYYGEALVGQAAMSNPHIWIIDDHQLFSAYM